MSVSDSPGEKDAPNFFPYAHSGEPDLPRYLRVRAEGIPLQQAIWSGLSYLRKYRSSKRSAPPEEIRYFDHQRALLRMLAQAAPPPGATIRLAAVGDLMWLRDGWSSFLDAAVLDALNGHDVVVGNLETPISPRFKVPSFWPDYLTYNSDPALLTSFRRANGGNTFQALATCNNHSLDRGDEGLSDTLGLLDSLHIAHAGVRASAQERSWITLEMGGMRIGFYAACWGLNDSQATARSRHHIEVLPNIAPSVRDPVDLARLRQALGEMRAERVDFKIVSLHWGHEFEFYPCPDIMRVGRDVVVAGADLVVGTHPHVVQPMEVCFVNGEEKRLRNSGLELAALSHGTGCVLHDAIGSPRKALIAYSLGNFATAMYTLHCRTGMALSLTLARNETGGVDWHRPETQLVHNVPREPGTRRRRLTLLESYLREREREGDPQKALREMAAFLKQHLLGCTDLPEPRR